MSCIDFPGCEEGIWHLSFVSTSASCMYVSVYFINAKFYVPELIAWVSVCLKFIHVSTEQSLNERDVPLRETGLNV